jgi:hypothetical protein
MCVLLPYDTLTLILYSLKFYQVSHKLMFVNYLLIYIVFPMALILINLNCL